MSNDDNVKLDDICQSYFNINAKTARHKAALGLLPVPAFRLTNSGRGPFFVSKESLDKLVADRKAAATKLHQEMAAIY